MRSGSLKGGKQHLLALLGGGEDPPYKQAVEWVGMPTLRLLSGGF